MVPGFAGNTDGGASAGLHLRLRGRGRQVPARAARRRAPPAIPVQRNYFRQVGTRVLGPAGALGLRVSLQHARRGVAGSDRPALSQHRLVAAEPRDIAALGAYKSAQGLLDLDHAVTSLLDADRETSGMTSAQTNSWDRARAVADAVLYEGYLLYPVSRDVQKESIPLAVRRFGSARCVRRRASAKTTPWPRNFWSTGRRRLDTWWFGSCSCSTAGPNANWPAAGSRQSTNWPPRPGRG